MALLFFFFNDTATTEIYTLSLHDALPVPKFVKQLLIELKEDINNNTIIVGNLNTPLTPMDRTSRQKINKERSEEHTSELQSRQYLVCRLLLEKKNNSLPSRVVSYFSLA